MSEPSKYESQAQELTEDQLDSVAGGTSLGRENSIECLKAPRDSASGLPTGKIAPPKSGFIGGSDDGSSI